MYSIYSDALNHVMLTYKACVNGEHFPLFEMLSQGFRLIQRAYQASFVSQAVLWCMQKDVEGPGEGNGWVSDTSEVTMRLCQGCAILRLVGSGSLAYDLRDCFLWDRDKGEEFVTSSYLSVVSNNDELHVFGCCLEVPFMLKE